jgi:D-glycero-D-manno-heptose 1,7-bisphosphate phosphatase
MIQLPLSATKLEPRLRACSTVFLDRDGTVNVKAPEGQYVTLATELFLIPGVGASIARLNAAGVRVILVTNQRWLSDPSADLTSYARVHARLEELLGADGAHLDGAYYCPHAYGSCNCRKPSPAMLQRAAREHGFDLSTAVMIGDSETDVAAGRAAGTTTILLRPEQQTTARGADFVVDNLACAVRLILGDSERERSGPDFYRSSPSTAVALGVDSSMGINALRSVYGSKKSGPQVSPNRE